MTTQGRSRNKDIARKGKKWAPATCNRYKALISMVYREGIKNGKVSVNPARQVERRRENNQRDRFLSPQEEKAVRDVISAARPNACRSLTLPCTQGMRRGEQYACEWSWIALDRKVLTVPRSKHGEKRRVFLTTPRLPRFVRSGSSRRAWARCSPIFTTATRPSAPRVVREHTERGEGGGFPLARSASQLRQSVGDGWC